MNWNLVSKPTAAIQEYHLSDDASTKIILKYNPLHRSARISYGINNRLFFIENTGQLSTKTLFKDQYGMETGSLVLDKWSDKIGTVTIDDKKYNCKLLNGDSPELIIYTTDISNPLASCRLNASQTNNTNILNNSCLLLSLCLYLIPVAKESFSAFA